MPRTDVRRRPWLARLIAGLVLVLGLPGAGLAQYGPPSPIGGGLAGSSEIASFGDGSAEPPATRVQTAGGGAYEYVVVGPQGDSDAVRRAIEAAGGTVLRTGTLSALGEVTTVSTFPSQASYDRARALIAQQAPRSSLAPQHLYRFAAGAGPRLYAPGLIGDPAPGRCRLTRPVTIGMIDGPVNPDHPALRRADVTYETLVPGTLVPGADHGTAVAALLVGEDDGGALAGFARGARLYAVSVFSERDDLEGASVERVAQGIDRLVAHGIRLINLSLAGPENAALGRAISAAAARGAVMIAASGNDRRPHVAWPAAAPEVIAVTAVDAARRRFFLANTGAELEFAAPGVDIYAARERGAGYMSGTSFAAPIVTALAARQMAHGVRSIGAIRQALQRGAQTLGPGQRNTDFGWGLVRADGC